MISEDSSSSFSAQTTSAVAREIEHGACSTLRKRIRTLLHPRAVRPAVGGAAKIPDILDSSIVAEARRVDICQAARSDAYAPRWTLAHEKELMAIARDRRTEIVLRRVDRSADIPGRTPFTVFIFRGDPDVDSAEPAGTIGGHVERRSIARRHRASVERARIEVVGSRPDWHCDRPS